LPVIAQQTCLGRDGANKIYWILYREGFSLYLGRFYDIYFKYLKGPITFCHSARKTKLLKFDWELKEGILRRLKNHRGFSTTNEHLRILSLRLMPSFNCEIKSNFNLFVLSWKWQNLTGPLKYLRFEIRTFKSDK